MGPGGLPDSRTVGTNTEHGLLSSTAGNGAASVAERRADGKGSAPSADDRAGWCTGTAEGRTRRTVRLAAYERARMRPSEVVTCWQVIQTTSGGVYTACITSDYNVNWRFPFIPWDVFVEDLLVLLLDVAQRPLSAKKNVNSIRSYTV